MAPSNALSLLLLLCLSIFTTTANSIATAPAQTAVTESLHKAQSTRALITNLANSGGLSPKEISALKTCLSVTSDSVALINQSLGEFSYISGAQGRYGLLLHINNVQTWMSAAMTDASTCSDEFESSELNGRIKSLVIAQVNDMSNVISNALALVNKLVPPSA